MCCDQNTVLVMHIQTLQRVHSLFVLAVGIAHNSKCSDIITEKYFLLHKLYGAFHNVLRDYKHL